MRSLQPHQKHNCLNGVWEDLLLVPSFLFLSPDDCEPIKFLFARQCEHARDWFRCLLSCYLFVSLRSGCAFSRPLMALKWLFTLTFAPTFSFVTVSTAVNHRVSKVLDTGSEGDHLCSAASQRAVSSVIERRSAVQSRCFHELNIRWRHCSLTAKQSSRRRRSQMQQPQNAVNTVAAARFGTRPSQSAAGRKNATETLSSCNHGMMRGRPRKSQKEIALACSSSPVCN